MDKKQFLSPEINFVSLEAKEKILLTSQAGDYGTKLVYDDEWIVWE